MEKIKGYKDSFLEVLWITKACFTTLWYWLPISFMAWMLFQLWMVFFVHPLTILILPIIVVLYGTLLEEKRTRLRYGLGKPRQFRSSHGVGEHPHSMPETEWEVEKTVNQYKQLLEKKTWKEHYSLRKGLKKSIV